MKKRIKQSEEGFTLLEVIIAIVISSIMLVGLASMIVNIRLINARARDIAVVNAIAVAKVEELRSNSYVSLEDGTYEFTDELPATITKNRSAEYIVNTVPGNPALKEVLVTISYNDFNDPVTYKYKTYIGELGVGQY